ncbi:MAG: hypothetical protein CBD47_06860 [Synechococcus sp. TMED187]|jgi:hypothetical protein|uniref:hypothetical protein n=1 Tax=Synechococcus sp. UW105 TaxID=337067 RepID=UPI000B6E7E59|nr:hypothetical protein [Synechococcus sp. UW105]OUW46374.1 MAG: hypothetical protein CBD47_06860 [Synechococcus sp. TMED187]|tara:strand:+ start:725 stop:994 length:270 start_codon:yes stop_codon:yes gene_type:complete
MAGLQDHDYLRLCAELASCLGISQSAARRRVEMAAAQEGLRDVEARKRIARQLLEVSRSEQESGEASSSPRLDALLAAQPEDENFMLED